MPLGKSPYQSLVPSSSYIGPSAPSIPSCIAPYVPRFLNEAPLFQPPTSPLPQNQCFPCTFPGTKTREPPPMPDSFYLPLLPPPPLPPQTSCTYPTPPSLFIPPSSLSYSPPTEVLLRGKPHVVPTVLPATFYTPFSRYYSQPRPYYRTYRRNLSSTFFPSLSPLPFDGSGRSVHFYRGS